MGSSGGKEGVGGVRLRGTGRRRGGRVRLGRWTGMEQMFSGFRWKSSLRMAMRAYRRERGQDALAPKGPSPLQGRARRLSRGKRACGGLRAAAASDGPWGRRHLAFAMRRQAHWFGSGWGHARLTARARARCPRPQGPVTTARARQEAEPRKGRAEVCEQPRPVTGPGGEGILPSLCAARRIGSAADWVMRACRRERGQDALAPRGPLPLQGRALLRGGRYFESVFMPSSKPRMVSGYISPSTKSCVIATELEYSHVSCGVGLIHTSLS